MTPIDRSIVEKKCQFIIRELDHMTFLLTEGVNANSDFTKQYAVCLCVQHAISAVIDIAQHIVVEDLNEVADTYSDSIIKLGTLGVLDRDFAKRFSKAASLRNVMVHMYSELNIDHVISILPQIIEDLEVFLKAIEKRLARG